MNRICIYVIYDPYEIGYLYIDHILEELNKYISELIVVFNSEYTKAYKKIVQKYTEKVILRENTGYDAAAYKEIINKYHELIWKYDELLLTNDTYYGPVYHFDNMFGKMNAVNCDYWGVTRHPGGCINGKLFGEHIQSYFLNFKSKIIHSKDFYDFWNMLAISNRINDTIFNFEIGINEFMQRRGYIGAAFVEQQGEKLLLEKNENPYLLFTKKMISSNKMPILKRKCLEFGNVGFGDALEALQYIRDNTEYDIGLIIDHIDRLSTIRTNNVKYNYIELKKFIMAHKNVYIYGDGLWAHNMDLFLEFIGYGKMKHTVSDGCCQNSSVVPFSKLDMMKVDGIIIAVSNPKVIVEIYNVCTLKFRKEDIFSPKDY